MSRASKDPKYGHLDKRPVYLSKGGSQDLHVQVKGVRQHIIRVCGYSHKESLKHALFYLDPNITNPHRSNYIPSNNQYLLTKRKYMQDECTQLTDIPLGDHVLTIRTDSKHPHHTTSFSHLIIF